MTKNRPLALIVDDEPDLRALLALSLSRIEIDSVQAGDKAAALKMLKKQHFDFCLTDLRLPDGSGIEIVKRIQKEFPTTPVAVITAHSSAETAVEALKCGAFDYIAKPLELEQLQGIIKTALRLSPKTSTNMATTLVGESDLMQAIRAMIIKVGRTQAPVYIHGETGTGKELIARLIHENSPRAYSPFIAVNCGAIPPDLMESEFFGHIKGSFSGAYSDKKGLFAAADQGTLFLDEVADLPLALQVKLLRSIQEKKIRPVGAVQEKQIDIRIISATHKDLKKMIDLGTFREDLYYRIHVISIRAPALRERITDIPILADYFLAQQKLDRPHQRCLSDGAKAALSHYPFPGNVRELENILERVLALTDDKIIAADDLNLPPYQPANTTHSLAVLRTHSLDQHLAAVEQDLIVQALQQSDGNITTAAQLLGITFRALRYKITKMKDLK